MNVSRNQWIGIGIVAAVLLGFAFVSCGNASAAPLYVKAEVGTTADTQVDTGFGSIEFTDGPVIGAYAGTAVGPVRVEAGIAHLSGDVNFFGLVVDGSANDYNATAYLDTSSGFYVGAGVDYIQAEASIGPFSIEQSGYGYHVSGGYAFAAVGGIVEVQATYLEASLDDVDLSGPRFTVGYRHAL